MSKITKKQITTALINEDSFLKKLDSYDKFVAAIQYKNGIYKDKCFDLLLTKRAIFFHLISKYSLLMRFCNDFPEHQNFAFNAVTENKERFVQLLPSSYRFTTVLQQFPNYAPKFFDVLFSFSIKDHLLVLSKFLQSAYSLASLLKAFPDYKHSIINFMLRESTLFNMLVKNFDDLYFILNAAPEQTDMIFRAIFNDLSLFKKIFITEHSSSILIYKQIKSHPRYSKLLWKNYFQLDFEKRLNSAITSKEHSKILLSVLIDDIDYAIQKNNFSTEVANVCYGVTLTTLKSYTFDEIPATLQELKILNSKLEKYSRYNLSTLCLLSLQQSGLLSKLVDNKLLPTELCDKANNVVSFF